jgi:hypothetical protein
MLKSVLALLLSKFVKRSDTEFIAQQSMPKRWEDKIFIAQGKKTLNGTYTAPCSGYVCIDGGSNISYIEIGDGPRSRQQVALTSGQVRLAWPEVYMPVKKGDSCTYAAEALDGNSDTAVYFIPAVGGQTS